MWGDGIPRSNSNGPTPLKMNIGGTPILDKAGIASENKMTPLTPTANLKVLMSAVSPALREKERQEKEASYHSKAVRAIFSTSKDSRVKVENDYDRKAKSLGLLCRKFLQLTDSEIGPNTPFSLEAVANSLGINRRRIYDIINIFESLELVEKHSKNLYAWHGVDSLPVTLGKLKAIAELEGPMIFCDRTNVLHNSEFQWRMKGGAFYDKFRLGSFPVEEDMTAERPITPCMSDWQFESFRADDDDDAEEKKNDRSLGLLCQKFIMLLLVLPQSEVTLDFAAQVILADDETIDMTGRAKPKVRRLYDIANVLVSMGLIAKDHYINTTEGCHKPGFYWVGPDIKNTSHIVVTRKPDIELLRGRKCSSKSVMSILGRKHLCGTKHSLLNCFDITVLRAPTPESTPPVEREKFLSHSAPSSPVSDGDISARKTTKQAILNTSQLELEAVLFGNEIKPLEKKYPKVYALVSEFLRKNCGEGTASSAPPVMRNPIDSEDKNEPVYIFNSQGIGGRRSSSRGEGQSSRLSTAGIKRMNSEVSMTAKRRPLEDISSTAIPGGVSRFTSEGDIHPLDQQPPTLPCATTLPFARKLPTDDYKQAIAGQPSTPRLSSSEHFQQLKGSGESFSPSVFLQMPQFLLPQNQVGGAPLSAADLTGLSPAVSSVAAQAFQNMSRVLVRPLTSLVNPSSGLPLQQLVCGVKHQHQHQHQGMPELQQQMQLPLHPQPKPILPKRPAEASVPDRLGNSPGEASSASQPVPGQGSRGPSDAVQYGAVAGEVEVSDAHEHGQPSGQPVVSSSTALPKSVSGVLSGLTSSLLPAPLASVPTTQELNAKLLQALIHSQSSQQLQSAQKLPLFPPSSLPLVQNALQGCLPPTSASMPLHHATMTTTLPASIQSQLSQLTSNLSSSLGQNQGPATAGQCSTFNLTNALTANLIGMSKKKSSSPPPFNKSATPVPLKPKKAQTPVKILSEQAAPRRLPLADVATNASKAGSAKLPAHLLAAILSQGASKNVNVGTSFGSSNLPNLHPVSNNENAAVHPVASTGAVAPGTASVVDGGFVTRLSSALQFLSSTNVTLNEETAELLAKVLNNRETPPPAVTEYSVAGSS